MVASDTIQVEVDDKESPPQDGHDPALTAAQQRNQDTEPVALLLDKHDSVPAITPDNLDAASIMMVPDNHDAAPITTPNNKYNAALVEGCNVQVSGECFSSYEFVSETVLIPKLLVSIEHYSFQDKQSLEHLQKLCELKVKVKVATWRLQVFLLLPI